MEFACPSGVRLAFRALRDRLGRRKGDAASVWRGQAIRSASAREIDAIVALSARVQEWLNTAGIAQSMGPIPREIVEAHVAAGTALALITDGVVAGSLFLEPVCRDSVTPRIAERLADWGVATDGPPLWFLQKFMVEPTRRGQRLGSQLLEHAKRVATEDGEARIVLDCWAGNSNLRAYYSGAGFRLHGIAAAADYEVAVFIWASTG